MSQKRQLLAIIKNLVNPVTISLLLFGCVIFYEGEFRGGYIPLLAVSLLLTIQLMDIVDVQSSKKTFWKKNAVGIVLQWFWVISLLLLIGFASKVTEYFSRQVLFTWFLITPIGLAFVHWLVRFWVHRWSFTIDQTSKAVIIGVNDLSRKLANEFKQNPLLGVTCLGFFDDRWSERQTEQGEPKNVDMLGSLPLVGEYVKANNVKQIYIALPMTSQPRILALLDDLSDTTASIYFVPDIFLYDLIQSNISSINNILVVAVCETPILGVNGTFKRMVDVGLSLIILVLFAPLLTLIALGVKMSSPGPVLFKQRRYGLDGEEILVYKFRSMSVMEDGNKVDQATRADPRITPFGRFLRKTSLDELPQFVNVLQGRMSIVGPRPHAISHNEMYRSLIKGYMIRHKVKPGITGLAQINGFRGETETVEKMQSRIDYDLDYLRNWSLFLDLVIIIKTIGVVIKDKNAY